MYMPMTSSNNVRGTSLDVVASLADALQTAIEAAVLPNRFEIDEQRPLSRLEALTEQLLYSEKRKHGSLLEMEAVDRTTTIIVDIVSRIRAQI
jgi:hypothetical protein